MAVLPIFDAVAAAQPAGARVAGLFPCGKA